MSPLVTIAIPTYNRAETYFPQTLQSALQQTYSNLEIIISDNCSTDRTPELVGEAGDPRVKYFRHEPGIGQRNNYNFCIEQAKGAYTLLLHDDDVIDNDFVAVCMAAAEANLEFGIIRTGVRIIDGEGNVVSQIIDHGAGLSIEGFFSGWFAGKAPIYCCNTVFNTQKLREIGGFRSRHFCYPDTMAIFELAARYPRIDLREIKASFRIHSGEAGSSRKIAEWCEDSLDLLQMMCDLAPQTGGEIMKDGARFLARANYARAINARSPRQRALALMKVMSYFRYREFPSPRLVVHILHGTPLYNGLRFIKRQAAGCMRRRSRKQNRLRPDCG